MPLNWLILYESVWCHVALVQLKLRTKAENGILSLNHVQEGENEANVS